MSKDLLEVVRSTKYPLEAFLFVQAGLDFTVRRAHGSPKTSEDISSRHVSGDSLCRGLKDYAIKQYGLLARTVLKHWGITECEDFGNIVFALVDAGLMHTTDEDTIDDFRGVYDFAEAFDGTLSLSENG